MFAPTVLRLLRLLRSRPGGVSREEIARHLADAPPEWVVRALDKLLEAGVVEWQGDRLVPLPGLKPLAERMVLLAHCLNDESQAADLVKVLFQKQQ